MRNRVLGGCLAAGLVLGTAVPAGAAAPGKELLVDQVRTAINKGIRFLRDQQTRDGSWEINAASAARKGGWTSLALLALLNAGVKPDDPIIQRGLKYLREVEPKDTYVVGLQTMVFVEAGFAEDRERIQRNVDWLVEARVRRGGDLIGWTYNKVGGNADNSNTQYALLGLWAGKVAGAKVEADVWKSIRDFYIRTQSKTDGTWSYAPHARGASSLTMTTAGLCGLLIAGMQMNEGRERLRADGSADNCGVYAENPALARAMGWMARGGYSVKVQYATFYNLYGLERAGRLTGQRFIGEHDWYREGCEFLVKEQRKDDGSWFISSSGFDSWPVVSTSFALLFLSKGRTPVLISKLAHGADWNNKHNDARHLVEYASREIFKKQPVAWQVFDAKRVEATNRDQLLNLTAQLLQSPIVYFNGHLGPRLTGIEKQLLKEYIDQGGFLLAEACCGREEFDADFRALMRELFPDNPLTDLPPEHPIWRAHALVPPNEFPRLQGIEMGCKTVVVYSPHPLAGYWENNLFQQGRGQLAFRLAGNIIAYATALELPKPRLTPVEIVTHQGEERKVQRGFLKVAQLNHGGDWKPAPYAMRNLMTNLRERARLDVALQTEEMKFTEPDLANFKLVYLHGRGSFTVDPQSLDYLRFNLETGGLLFSDAACGKKAFDASFREFAEKLFPDKKLEPIPLTDDLYSKDLSGTAITTVRCRRERADGQGAEEGFRDAAPFLEGIKLNGRWVVIYSKYDIGCALEKRQSSDCVGHDHESALKLAGAVVLYALKR